MLNNNIKDRFLGLKAYKRIPSLFPERGLRKQ